MTQISRQFLPPNVENKVRNLLIECVCLCQDQKSAANFIDVLLTPTEKIMIAKRIAIALMWAKGYTGAEIKEKLKVSEGTIYNVKIWLDTKGVEYRKVLEELVKRDKQQEEEHQNAIAEAESPFPPMPGINWKEHSKRQWQKVEQSKVPF